MSTKSELGKSFMKRIKNNKKFFKILKIYKGKHAVQKTKNLFFGKDKKKATKWAKHWNNYEKSQSLFVIYEYKKRIHKYISFRFLIGNMETGSSLGESYKYDKGVEKMKSI